MSYTPNTWQTGDTVTAEKLNNIESGIDLAANAFTITLTPTAVDMSGTMNKTPAEISEAISDGKQIVGLIPSMNALVIFTQFMSSEYDGVICAGQFIIDYNGPVLVNVVTSDTDSTYSTGLFPLTPMS